MNTCIVPEPPPNKWKIRFYDWIGVPLIGGAVISLGVELEALITGDFAEYLESVIISGTFWSVLANGNAIIITFLDKHWTWLEHPVKRLTIGIVALLIYTPIASLLVIYLYVSWYFGLDFGKVVSEEGFWAILIMPLAITIVVALWQHGRGFLLAWRQEAINVERLKNENLRSKFESLSAQVNPHFLFNSLNALSSLVYEDQKKAELFIQKLSDVYRYVIDHQNDEVVDLQEEIEFLKSFIYLNKIRFGDNLRVDFVGQEELRQGWVIPPVTLQLILENCIKHNEISKQNILKIEIKATGEMLTITNNVNPMKSVREDSMGVGLANIASRYELLSDKKVKIDITQDEFKVSIPLLRLQS